jgi:error-prone DNA polymerase
LVLSRQRPGTASGVVFITLEDETGFANLIVYGELFEKIRLVAQHSTLLLAHGKIERQLTPPRPHQAGRPVPVVHVIVERLERLDLPNDELAQQAHTRENTERASKDAQPREAPAPNVPFRSRDFH